MAQRPNYVQLPRTAEIDALIRAGCAQLSLDPEARGSTARVMEHALREAFGPVEQSVLKAQLYMATDMLYRLLGPDSAAILRDGLLQWAEGILGKVGNNPKYPID
jgi:hypothetical protein